MPIARRISAPGPARRGHAEPCLLTAITTSQSKWIGEAGKPLRWILRESIWAAMRNRQNQARICTREFVAWKAQSLAKDAQNLESTDHV
jgi:hypothetical protein